MIEIKNREATAPHFWLQNVILTSAVALLVALACIVLVPGQARAATQTVAGNYAVLEGTTLTFKYSAAEIEVPADSVCTGYDTAEYNYRNPAPWTSWSSKIEKVVFDASLVDGAGSHLRPVSTVYWFYECTNLTSVDNIARLDTSGVTSMYGMFRGCSSLASLDLSGLDTSHVTNMGSMFWDCSSLSSINLSGLDISRVTDAVFMFAGCKSLSSLDLSGINSSGLASISGMFRDCSSLVSLDLSSLDTSNVTEMGGMFWGCTSLSSLNMSGIDTSGVTDMVHMFEDCTSLTSLDLSGFNTSSVAAANGMFSRCSSLRTVYVGKGWSSAKVNTSENMFLGCTSLVGGNGTAFDASHLDAEYARVDAADAPGYFTFADGPHSMYRLYNPNSGEHFYTSAQDEHDNLVSVGWNDEGIGWTAPLTSATPVHRMYNPNAGEHHYTTDAGEKDHLVSVGWNYEGIGWYSDDQKRVPLYRDYNPNAFANNHNYTTDASEHAMLMEAGWNDEGFAWYGL